MTDIIIVGAGPAGLTAGIYAARAGAEATVFEKGMYGGQAVLTGEIDNFPTRRSIHGADLARQMYEHAQALGVKFAFEEVREISADGAVKRVMTAESVHEARALIIAAGAARRPIGCAGETEFAGRGVSYCATCDAAFFRGKTVAVVGGGNTALSDALLLAAQCERVYLVHRRAEFRGQRTKQAAVFAHPRIEVTAPAEALRIEGDTAVRGLRITSPRGERLLAVDGVFAAVGSVPDTALLRGILPLDGAGYAQAGEGCETPIAGVYVAGDLRAKPLRQIVTAACDGAVAAAAAAEYCHAQGGR